MKVVEKIEDLGRLRLKLAEPVGFVPTEKQSSSIDESLLAELETE